jgi:branched-chain amino acid aminotransferase
VRESSVKGPGSPNLFIEFVPGDLGIPTEVRDLTLAELYASDEAFLCGTGGEVTPITSVDDNDLGKEYPGLFTKRIADHYSQILTGKVVKYAKRLASL